MGKPVVDSKLEELCKAWEHQMSQSALVRLFPLWFICSVVACNGITSQWTAAVVNGSNPRLIDPKQTNGKMSTRFPDCTVVGRMLSMLHRDGRSENYLGKTSVSSCLAFSLNAMAFLHSLPTPVGKEQHASNVLLSESFECPSYRTRFCEVLVDNLITKSFLTNQKRFL